MFLGMEQVFKEFSLRSASLADCAAAGLLVQEVMQEYGLKAGAQTFADLNDLEKSYFSGGGFFGVVFGVENELVGTFGLYPLSEGRAEIRKMYLKPQARGKGLGKYLLESLLSHAREKGFKQVELETAGVLKEAIGLYTRYGFKPLCRAEATCGCDQAFALDL